MIKNLSKKLFLLFICSAGAVIILVRGFSHGLLSPHGLRIAALMLAFGMGTSAVLIVIKSAKKYRSSSGTAEEVSKDTPTRERRLVGIRLGQICIIILLILLVMGLRDIGRDTLLPTLVGAVINLWITVLLIRWVMRQKKSIN